MTTKPIIIFNGPPRSGKDCLAGEAARKGGRHVPVYSFKEPLFEIAAATLNMSLPTFRAMYDHKEGWKDDPTVLNGKTIRQLLIQISEVYIKPFFGSNYFGEAALRRVQNNYRNEETVSYFSDGGFIEEEMVLAEAFPGRIIVVRLRRDGTDFIGDSRSYIPTRPEWYTIDLANNGTVEEALDELNSRVTELGFDPLF